MSADLPPPSCKVLVVGGGPAGSYAATVLAREGLDVVLLEAAKHPREHVGESMLPSMRHYLKFIDLEEKFDSQGFRRKPGAAFKFVQDQREVFSDFNILGPSRTTWNVIRAQADDIMIRHAAEQGAKVFQETRVESLGFDDSKALSMRPISASWKNKQGHSGEVRFEWLVDASGRQGIMSTKYLKNRIFREGLRNVAAYGYWRGVTVYEEGGRRANAPWFEAMTDRTGWAWVIPLHEGLTSIGVVMHQHTSKRKKAEQPGSLTDHYMQQLQLCPGVQELIGNNATFVEGSVRSTADYSYHATAYSGDSFRLVGDAAAFVDPLFSSGVHAAMNGALSAASTILGVIRGEVTEEEAQAWHDAKVGICQTRFLMVVLSAYRQMKHVGNSAMVSDINADNFDAAFEFFRPIYQGESDTASKLSENEMENMIAFTRNLFTPTTHEQTQEVAKRVGPELMSLSGPVMGSADLDKVLDSDDSDAKAVLRRLNSLKILKNESTPESFTWEAVNGYIVRLERGKLGLIKA